MCSITSFPRLFFGTITYLPGSFSQLLHLSMILVLLRRVWALKLNKLKMQWSHEQHGPCRQTDLGSYPDAPPAHHGARPPMRRLHTVEPVPPMRRLHTTGHVTSHGLSPARPSSQRYDHHVRYKTASTGPDIQQTFKGEIRSLLFILIRFLKINKFIHVFGIQVTDLEISRKTEYYRGYPSSFSSSVIK